MARVYNWQIGREMSYWYPESRPKRQFAAVFDINKCIACQTCTLACKTTWTSGKGQEYMLWNNVEIEALRLLSAGLGPEAAEDARRRRSGTAASTPGGRSSRRPPAGERVLGWRPGRPGLRLSRTSARTTAPASIDDGARPAAAAPAAGSSTWRASATTAPIRPAWPPARAARSTSGRKTASCWWTRAAAAATASACKGCPYKKVFFNPLTGTSEKCIACFPKIEQGLQPQCFVNCIGKIRLAGWVSTARRGQAREPDRLPRARPEGGAAAVPAVRPGAERLLHPADPRPASLPAADVRSRRGGGHRDLSRGAATTPIWPGCWACSARPTASCRAGSARASWIIGPEEDGNGDHPRAAARAGLHPQGVRREARDRPHELPVEEWQRTATRYRNTARGCRAAATPGRRNQ